MTQTDLTIPDTKPLQALQNHMARLCAHLGWDEARNEQTFLLFVEEIGELAKAIRNISAFSQEKGKAKRSETELRQNLEEEFSDVFSYLLDLANRFDVDLGKAYTAKMTANLNRSWV